MAFTFAYAGCTPQSPSRCSMKTTEHGPLLPATCATSRAASPYSAVEEPVLHWQDSSSYTLSSSVVPHFSHWLAVGCYESRKRSATTIRHGTSTSRWEPLGDSIIGIAVDTAFANFPSQPTYIVNVVGRYVPPSLLGARTVINSTSSSFSVAIALHGHSSAELMALAADHGWTVHWTGVISDTATHTVNSWYDSPKGIAAVTPAVKGWSDTELTLYSLAYNGKPMPCIITALEDPTGASITAVVKTDPSGACLPSLSRSIEQNWTLNVVVVDPSRPEFAHLRLFGRTGGSRSRWEQHGDTVSYRVALPFRNTPGCAILTATFVPVEAASAGETVIEVGENAAQAENHYTLKMKVVTGAENLTSLLPRAHYIIANCNPPNGDENADIETFSTESGGSWALHERDGIVGHIDTTAAAFTSTPTYVYTLYAPEAAHLRGMHTVVDPTPTSFRVWIRSPTMSPEQLLNAAQTTWSIRWMGSTDPSLTRKNLENDWSVSPLYSNQQTTNVAASTASTLFYHIVDDAGDLVIRDVGTALSQQFHCPVGSIPYQDRCLANIVEPAGFTWEAAEDRCLDLGGVLPSIRSADELQAAASLCTVRCWTGLRIQPDSDLILAYQWADGSSVAGFSDSWVSSGSVNYGVAYAGVVVGAFGDGPIITPEPIDGKLNFTLCALPRTTAPNAVQPRCPPGFSFAFQSCWAVKYSEETTSYETSVSQCSDIGASPASAASLEEMAFAYVAGGIPQRAFIGGVDRPATGFFTFLDGALFSPKHLFAPVYPDQVGVEMCTEVLQHPPTVGVNDLFCTDNRPVVCRRGTLDQPRCGNGFTEGNGYCWKVLSEKGGGFEAEGLCRSYGSHQSSVTTESEFLQLQRRAQNFWIGYQRVGDTFRATDGTPYNSLLLGYPNWSTR